MDEVLAKPLQRERLEAVLEKYAPPVGTRTGRHVVRPAAERTMAEKPELALARFREVTMGDPVLARGLIQSFVASIGQCLQQAEAAIAAGNEEQLTRSAHTIAGSAANIGAARLEAAAASLESIARRGEFGVAKDLLPSLQKRYAAARAALEKLI
jgi:hypothetical protein